MVLKVDGEAHEIDVVEQKRASKVPLKSDGSIDKRRAGAEACLPKVVLTPAAVCSCGADLGESSRFTKHGARVLCRCGVIYPVLS